MARTVLKLPMGSWSAAVVVATVCASFAMVATAAVSVLSGEQVAAAGDLYGADERPTVRSGKRAVRAVAAQRPLIPFPDTCSVTYVPFDQPLLGAMESIRSVGPSVRPLQEAVEIPDNFI